ncbi:hypothetical protein LIER_18751 [Lithospermum erythrorhizon]|uniref:Uncharacterized protein n=1 Tax=Lithospermum erythrorhizon TaxID=34254 RepID=A0AAV3QGT4_LITER
MSEVIFEIPSLALINLSAFFLPSSLIMLDFLLILDIYVIGVVNPNVLLEEDIENKIDVADALSVKLLKRFNYSVSTMRTCFQDGVKVHGLQVELGELKGRVTKAISICDVLCKRIARERPESLQSSIKPFAPNSTDVESSRRLALQKSDEEQAAEEGKCSL